MPMKNRPEKDLKHPPGQIVTPISGVPYNFEKPLQGLVEDYTSESHQKALQDAFERGYRIGYRYGFAKALRVSPDSILHLDPNSEESR